MLSRSNEAVKLLGGGAFVPHDEKKKDESLPTDRQKAVSSLGRSTCCPFKLSPKTKNSTRYFRVVQADRVPVEVMITSF